MKAFVSTSAVSLGSHICDVQYSIAFDDMEDGPHLWVTQFYVHVKDSVALLQFLLHALKCILRICLHQDATPQ